MWGGMLSSGKVGTYRMCVACRKCDRPQNDKRWPVLYFFGIFIHFFCILLIILAAIYPRTLSKKKSYLMLVVSLRFSNA